MGSSLARWQSYFRFKGTSSISYNHLNLPNGITYSNANNIEIVYDANEGKLHKMVIRCADLMTIFV
jgi:hypothetical protein